MKCVNKKFTRQILTTTTLSLVVLTPLQAMLSEQGILEETSVQVTSKAIKTPLSLDERGKEAMDNFNTKMAHPHSRLKRIRFERDLLMIFQDLKQRGSEFAAEQCPSLQCRLATNLLTHIRDLSPTEAILFLREAITLLEQSGTGDSERLSCARNRLGVYLINQAKKLQPAEAIPLLIEAITVLEKSGTETATRTLLRARKLLEEHQDPTSSK